MVNEFAKLEDALLRVGREFDYPATPPLAARVRAELNSLPQARPASVPRPFLRLLVPLAAAIILALALLLAVPTARETIAQILGLRGLQIFYLTPTPAPTQTPVATPTPVTAATSRATDASALNRTVTSERVPVTATPRASATPSVQPFTVCCEMTLEQARDRAHFELLLPSGELPSKVYYQQIFDEGEQVVMVFGDPASPRMTFYQAQRWVYGKLIGKMIAGGTVIGETQVNGERALWFSGAPHVVLMLDRSGRPVYETARTVGANTLVWETGDPDLGIIYRLETKLDLEQAVRIAGSLE
jgi:hypothetical protein